MTSLNGLINNKRKNQLIYNGKHSSQWTIKRKQRNLLLICADNIGGKFECKRLIHNVADNSRTDNLNRQ